MVSILEFCKCVIILRYFDSLIVTFDLFKRFSVVVKKHLLASNKSHPSHCNSVAEQIS